MACSFCKTPDAKIECPECALARYCNEDCRICDEFAGHDIECEAFQEGGLMFEPNEKSDLTHGLQLSYITEGINLFIGYHFDLVLDCIQKLLRSKTPPPFFIVAHRKKDLEVLPFSEELMETSWDEMDPSPEVAALVKRIKWKELFTARINPLRDIVLVFQELDGRLFARKIDLSVMFESPNADLTAPNIELYSKVWTQHAKLLSGEFTRKINAKEQLQFSHDTFPRMKKIKPFVIRPLARNDDLMPPPNAHPSLVTVGNILLSKQYGVYKGWLCVEKSDVLATCFWRIVYDRYHYRTIEIFQFSAGDLQESHYHSRCLATVLLAAADRKRIDYVKIIVPASLHLVDFWARMGFSTSLHPSEYHILEGAMEYYRVHMHPKTFTESFVFRALVEGGLLENKDGKVHLVYKTRRSSFQIDTVTCAEKKKAKQYPPKRSVNK